MTAPIIGRDDHLDTLRALVERAPEQGGALLLLGDAGIGKSTLLRAVVDMAAAAGFRVVTATGVESESELPYAGLADLLRELPDRFAALPAAQRDALLTALGHASGSAPEPFLVSLATLSVLTDAAADRPVLVAVDDVQWLDAPSHEAVAFLARRVGRDPVVVVVVARSGHPGPSVQAGLPELVVPALDDDASRAVLQAHADGLSYSARERILRNAFGNPLALVELPRSSGDPASAVEDALPLSARLVRAFGARIEELPQATRDVLLVTAVDNVEDVPEILRAATELAGAPVSLEAFEPATAAGIVVFDEMRVTFRHPLVRSGVLQTETMARRQAAHGALARVLDGDEYRQAWHRAHAIDGPDDDVADELERTHRTALARGSPVGAIWALERAAQLTTDGERRARLLLLAAEQAFGLGRADLVDRLLVGAEQLPLTDIDRVRMEWIREIFNDGVPGDAGRVFELCAISRRSFEAGDAELALNLLLAAALRCWWADTGPSARAEVARVAHEFDDVDDDPRWLAALAVAEPVLAAAEVAKRLDDLALESISDPDALRLYGMAAHVLPDPVLAASFLARSEARLRQQGRLGLLSHVLTMAILDLAELGDWQQAAMNVDEATRLAHDTGQPIWDTGTMSLAAIVAALRGDSERAHRLASDAEQSARHRNLNNLLACVQLARGISRISEGRHSDAYDELRRLFDHSDPAFHLVERFHGVMFLAEAAVHSGRIGEARAVVADLELDATTTPSPTLHHQLAYARAVLADDEDTETLYIAALSQDLTRWPWHRARLELAYGAWLRRHRRSAESRSPLRASLTTLELIGATTWAELARIELRAAGERAGEPAPVAMETLSPQELQIARLAAEGLTNREIGEQLFLSHRTVGSHLYRIFPKLGITSRAQLAPRLSPPT